MKAYRLVHRAFAHDALSGEGARRYGGRWNSKGQRMVYLADSLALVTLEVLVHTQAADDLLDYVWLELSFDAELLEKISDEQLPQDWRESPAPESTRALGNRWLLKQSSLLLRVPSAVLPQQHNFLLNPTHPNMTRLQVSDSQALDIDPRLLKHHN